MNKTDTEKHPILYSFRRCPYAMRARMALYKAGIAVELREVDLKDKPDDMLDASPKGTVPVLILPGGKVIDESFDIMEWALACNDPDNWLGADKTETAFLVERNDNEFKRALDRYKYPNRYPKEDCSWARDACVETLQDLNRRLEINGGALAADKTTLADIAVFPFIRQCAFVDKKWFDGLNMPHLHTWLDTHLESALFKAIMLKLKAWAPGDPPVYLASLSS